jgi:transmembrane sensor
LTRHHQTNEERLEQAMDWFLRLREPSRTKADEQDFTHWINQSPLNRHAWTKACRTWKVMGEVDFPVRQNEPGEAQSQPASPPLTGTRRWAISAGAVALAACLIAFVAGPTLVQRYEADYTTATAETRTIRLEDGSTVDLGAVSAIAVNFSGTAREVRLLSGQAYFDVRPDTARPFTVDTGELDVTVVGTGFDVNITPEIETVQLAHGAVSLSATKSGEALTLRPGDVVTLNRSNGRLSRATTSVESIAAWRDGKLFVQDVPISTVVSELQRYHSSWIALASGELGERRITGLYDLSDPDRALEALVSPYGGKVHHVSPYLRVLSLY